MKGIKKDSFDEGGEQFRWVGFYMEFATKLLVYKNDRTSLIEKLQKVYSDIGMKLPKLEKDNVPKDIDPFTVFGLFNKGITDANRVSILGGIKFEFVITADEEIYPEKEYKMSGNQIGVSTLNLDSDFFEIRSQLDGIVENYFGKLA